MTNEHASNNVRQAGDDASEASVLAASVATHAHEAVAGATQSTTERLSDLAGRVRERVSDLPKPEEVRHAVEERVEEATTLAQSKRGLRARITSHPKLLVALGVAAIALAVLLKRR